jgi:DNA uptake protein ComE-like DNA-binding protein
MFARSLWITMTIFGLAGASAVLQTGPSTRGSAPQARSVQETESLAGRVNLNTAPASDLRKLPRLSPGTVTAIIEARTKSKFQDWDDLVARRIVPPFAEGEIKHLVTF